MTDESCCDAEAGQIVAGGPRPTEDNTNDTAISPFNTCLANTLTMSSAAKIKPETLKKSSLNKLLVKRAGIQ